MANEFKLKKLFVWETLHDKISNSGGIKTVKVELTPAQIKTLGSSPVELIPAPGAGKYILVTGADVVLTYGTTPYNFGGVESLRLITDTAVQYQATIQGYLNSANSFFARCLIGYGRAVVENKALTAFCSDGDATQGDSPITIYVHYMIGEL